MKQDLENLTNKESEKVIGPLNFTPIVKINIETNTLIISEQPQPEIHYKKREWGLTDWFNYLFFKEKPSEKIEVYQHKPQIERHRIKQVNSFRIQEKLYSSKDSKEETTEYFVHYWQTRN